MSPNRLKLPGRFYELNIHYGLFVGGLGDFREIFLGLWDNFRGCLNELNYNGVDVLAKAKDRDKSGIASSATTAVVQVGALTHQPDMHSIPRSQNFKSNTHIDSFIFNLDRI